MENINFDDYDIYFDPITRNFFLFNRINKDYQIYWFNTDEMLDVIRGKHRLSRNDINNTNYSGWSDHKFYLICKFSEIKDTDIRLINMLNLHNKEVYSLALNILKNRNE